MSSDVRNSLKFGKIFQKDLLCTKMKKNGYREFDFSGTLTIPVSVPLAETYIPTYAYTFNLRHKLEK